MNKGTKAQTSGNQRTIGKFREQGKLEIWEMGRKHFVFVHGEIETGPCSTLPSGTASLFIKLLMKVIIFSK